MHQLIAMSTATQKITSTIRALVVDDELSIGRMLATCLESDGHAVTVVTNAFDAIAQARRRAFDIVFLDLHLGDQNGLDYIEPLLATHPWLRVVIITAFAAVPSAVEAMKRGASDYLPKPFTPEQVRLIIKKVIDLQALAQRANSLQEALSHTAPAVSFDTASTEFREAIELARSAAAGNAAVFIHGEPGTGKRTLARAIHAWSPRADRPFGIASCIAPTPAHLEAEWFGSLRKMPHGEVAEKSGRVAYCNGGTLVIEDLDRLLLTVQPKLLRLVQEREYEPLANFVVRRADVRVIAITSENLDEMVAAGEFQSDLLYALRAVKIELPPLRRRVDDIAILAERYLAFFARQLRRPVIGFTSAAMNALACHSWPGNIRELRNLIERAVLVSRGERIDTFDFPLGSLNSVGAVALGDPISLERIEELHIRGVLAACPSIDAAAEILGMDSVTLWRRRKKYGI
jgi:NtrC-family two-component system response regulator AlgB